MAGQIAPYSNICWSIIAFPWIEKPYFVFFQFALANCSCIDFASRSIYLFFSNVVIKSIKLFDLIRFYFRFYSGQFVRMANNSSLLNITFTFKCMYIEKSCTGSGHWWVKSPKRKPNLFVKDFRSFVHLIFPSQKRTKDNQIKRFTWFCKIGKILSWKCECRQIQTKELRTNVWPVLVGSWLLKYWIHETIRYKSSPFVYSLFHPRSPTRMLCTAQTESACAGEMVDTALSSVCCRFSSSLSAPKHAKQEMLNVKPSSMNYSGKIGDFQTSNDWINRCLLHADADRRTKVTLYRV